MTLLFIAFSGLSLSACGAGSSVNTNSASYQAGYQAGYEGARFYATNGWGNTEGEMCYQAAPGYSDPDYKAGCRAGWTNGQ